MRINTLFLLVYFFFLFSSILIAEHPDSSLKYIKKRQSYFFSASKIFNVDNKTLMGVVFVERTLNFDWKDDALDITMAKSGYNSSIGFCQIKLKTAYFIEKTLSDTLSNFFPNHKYLNILSLSNSSNELIQKLKNDSLNILFASAYLCIIQSYWDKKGFNITKYPNIIGTLYSTGLYSHNGNVRKPNKNPQANYFGQKVKESMYLFK